MAHHNLTPKVNAQAKDHHGGYAADVEMVKVLNRRRALGLFGTASTAAILTACGGDTLSGTTGTGTTATPTSTAIPPPAASSSGSCTRYASETNGPYPADGTNGSRGATSNVLPQSNFQRADVRSSVLSKGMAAGLQLTFTITLVDVNNSCAAMEGYAIYMWHCDANGDYSLYDIPSQDYLRGIQTTDANGQVTFTTIIPGTYNGRYPHIHFEVFSSLTNATTGRYAVLVSQFAIPKDQLATIYASDTRYTGSVAALNNVTLASDNVFGDNTTAQQEAMMIDLTGSNAAGYTASATVGIAT